MATTSRPFGVTLVALLALLSGLVNVVQGVITLSQGAESFNVTGAWVVIALGVITILVSLGLFRGSNAARVLVTIVFVISLAANLYAAFTVPGQLWVSVVGALLALIGLILLYTRAAGDYFRGGPR